MRNKITPQPGTGRHQPPDHGASGGRDVSLGTAGAGHRIGGGQHSPTAVQQLPPLLDDRQAPAARQPSGQPALPSPSGASQLSRGGSDTAVQAWSLHIGLALEAAQPGGQLAPALPVSASQQMPLLVQAMRRNLASLQQRPPVLGVGAAGARWVREEQGPGALSRQGSLPGAGSQLPLASEQWQQGGDAGDKAQAQQAQQQQQGAGSLFRSRTSSNSSLLGEPLRTDSPSARQALSTGMANSSWALAVGEPGSPATDSLAKADAFALHKPQTQHAAGAEEEQASLSKQPASAASLSKQPASAALQLAAWPGTGAEAGGQAAQAAGSWGQQAGTGIELALPRPLQLPMDPSSALKSKLPSAPAPFAAAAAPVEASSGWSIAADARSKPQPSGGHGGPGGGRGSSKGSGHSLIGLPVKLPFPAGSYICKAMDKGARPRLTEYFSDTPFWMDIFAALAALVQAVLTLYMAVLQEAYKNKLRESFVNLLLTIFSIMYPVVTMGLLIVRANEISMRKEVYYVLLRYRLVLDWQNWGWRGKGGVMSIPLRSHFFRYWIATMGVLAYWAWLRSAYQCIVVVVMQTFGLWRYYQSTLMVEQSLLSFNKSLEDEDGVMDFKRAEQYLHSGLSTVTEATVRQWAAHRWRSLPSERTLFRRHNPRFKEELQAWQAEVAGDLAALPSATTADFPLSWAYRKVARHFLGRSTLHVLCWHPDFAAANAGARWFLDGSKWPQRVGLAVVLGVEFYGIWQQLPTFTADAP